MSQSQIEAQKELHEKELLKECAIWLYETPYSQNAAENSKIESKVQDANRARGDKTDTWFLPGYFNTILKGKTGDGTPKVKRTITMKKGKSIFCMVASDHATKFEVGEETPSADRLREHVRKIHAGWDEVRLTIDGIVQDLDDVETDVFNVTLPMADDKGEHPYVQYYKDFIPKPSGGAKTPMITRSKVAFLDTQRITDLGLDDGKEHTIHIYALSSGDASLKEIAYEIDVRYKIRIVP